MDRLQPAPEARHGAQDVNTSQTLHSLGSESARTGSPAAHILSRQLFDTVEYVEVGMSSSKHHEHRLRRARGMSVPSWPRTVLDRKSQNAKE